MRWIITLAGIYYVCRHILFMLIHYVRISEYNIHVINTSSSPPFCFLIVHRATADLSHSCPCLSLDLQLTGCRSSSGGDPGDSDWRDKRVLL